MAKIPHYMVDLFFADAGASDGLRKEHVPIKALTDDQATQEAKILLWRKPVRYEVRAVTNGGDRIIDRWPHA